MVNFRQARLSPMRSALAIAPKICYIVSAMPNFFFTDATGKKQGPLNALQLKALAERGIITPTTLLETDTGHKGTAGQLRGLFPVPPVIPTPHVIPAQAGIQTKEGNVISRRRFLWAASSCGVLLAGGFAFSKLLSVSNDAHHVIPAQAGIQTNDTNAVSLDPRLRGGDGEQPPPQQPRAAEPPAEPTGFTPQQLRRIEELKRELMDINNPRRVNIRNAQEMQMVEEAIRQIDPSLIGRNIIFGPRWLEFMGDGKPMPRAPFQQWRNRADIIYDGYADLTGQGPGPRGERQKILVDLHPRASFRAVDVRGTASGNLVLINKNHAAFSRDLIPAVVRHNSWDLILMHELAHCFTMGTRRFTYDAEAICDLLTAYVLENTAGARMGTPGGRGNDELMIGNRFRKQLLDRILIRIRTNPNSLSVFSGSANATSASNYLALGPVDLVGWEPYKQVFRSYNDATYTHPVQYTGGDARTLRAREFFDRLAHFSGKPDLMASSAIGRQLFNQHFGVGANVVATAR